MVRKTDEERLQELEKQMEQIKARKQQVGKQIKRRKRGKERTRTID